MNSHDTQQMPVLTFRLGEQFYALPVDEVIEVAAMVELINAPGLPQEVLGFANRQGEAIPVLDLRWVFLQQSDIISLTTLFIVVVSGEQKCGVVVDEVLTVEYVTGVPTTLDHQHQHFIHGMVQHDQQLLQLVSVPVLIDTYVTDYSFEHRNESD